MNKAESKTNDLLEYQKLPRFARSVLYAQKCTFHVHARVYAFFMYMEYRLEIEEQKGRPESS